MLWYVVALCLLGVSWAEDCQVANIQVMQHFDKTRVSRKIPIVALCSVLLCNDAKYSDLSLGGLITSQYAGTWYAVAKKDPVGLFLYNNIKANFGINEDGNMNATAKGKVKFGDLGDACVEMFGTFEDTSDPAKFKMTYYGAAAYLQTGYDDHWVIDTDYDNYAVHYSCRKVDENGMCENSYSFIFSRHLTGLRAEDQAIVQEKKGSLCLKGKYRRIEHDGSCDNS